MGIGVDGANLLRGRALVDRALVLVVVVSRLPHHVDLVWSLIGLGLAVHNSRHSLADSLG